MDSEIDIYENPSRWIQCGVAEILTRFFPNKIINKTYPDISIYSHSHLFKKRNTNRYFYKHLGFTYQYIEKTFIISSHGDNRPFIQEQKNGLKIKINDHKKFLLFKIKYGLI